MQVSSKAYRCGEAEAETLRDIRARGFSLPQCAKHMGYSQPVIIRWLRELGLPPAQPQPTRVTPADLVIITDALADGWAVAQIAKHMGIGPEVIARAARRHKLKRGPRRWRYGTVA